jgi:hypothetical protein
MLTRFPTPTCASSLLRPAAVLFCLLAAAPRSSGAQVRERPVSFDSAGRVMTITPPLASRLGLEAPLWPVTGDYIDAALYSTSDASDAFVIVVRRQRAAVDRYPFTADQRAALAGALSRARTMMRATSLPDDSPTLISEPVRGQFVANQAGLGVFLFGPAAAALTDDPAVGGAAYLLVAGGTFFYSAALTQSTPVSRAQNHLAAHSAFRGAVGSGLALYALGGDHLDSKAYAAAALAGGLFGDVAGFQLARPMTDAEAHGTSHGSTVATVLTAGTLGALGGGARAGAAGAVVGGILGYPLGLRYVRTAPYRVTAGDAGAMLISELLGTAVAATALPNNPSDQLTSGMLTVGYAVGALAGDRLLVRPFDHSESDARLLALGTGAGALVGLAVPTLLQARNGRVVGAAATIGGLLGAILTEQLIAPAAARPNDGPDDRRIGAMIAPPREERRGRFDVRFSPEAMALAGARVRGRHSLLSVGF